MKKSIVKDKTQKKTKQKARALVLFSGGLDSRLVVKLLQEQNVRIELVYFSLPFGCGCCNNLECNFNFSQTNMTKLHILDCTKGKLFQEYMKIVINPKYGYGKSLNPCMHCRIFMLEEAKKLMKELKCNFIATGEVLGQRPMSQYKQALLNIEKETKLEGMIVRPLSASLLPETLAAREKLIDISKFPSIVGRNRNIQIALAKKFNITFPTPAGGCLLCDKNYSAKLKDFLNHINKREIMFEEIETLRIGRHFRKKGKIVLGRNEKENILIIDLAPKINYLTIIPTKNGPTAIFEDKDDKLLAKKLIEAYSSKDLKLREKFENIRIK